MTDVHLSDAACKFKKLFSHWSEESATFEKKTTLFMTERERFHFFLLGACSWQIALQSAEQR